ncbi:hypothetical protein B0H15DRAFT_802717 [Mycena belliarum]|uniref:Uncharacterized protein n=1 Tax=Mycena belliarum TaxID=1033014 RepID=A0AAD6TZF9_9AGAR|nr:hypothetical protein B0H15DRAFT_802717 [Mycena belliae]
MHTFVEATEAAKAVEGRSSTSFLAAQTGSPSVYGFHGANGDRAKKERPRDSASATSALLLHVLNTAFLSDCRSKAHPKLTSCENSGDRAKNQRGRMIQRLNKHTKSHSWSPTYFSGRLSQSLECLMKVILIAGRLNLLGPSLKMRIQLIRSLNTISGLTSLSSMVSDSQEQSEEDVERRIESAGKRICNSKTQESTLCTAALSPVAGVHRLPSIPRITGTVGGAVGDWHAPPTGILGITSVIGGVVGAVGALGGVEGAKD